MIFSVYGVAIGKKILIAMLDNIHFKKEKQLRTTQTISNQKHIKKKNLENKKTIWTQNANADYWKEKSKFSGDVGKIYGVQWRNFNGVDQLKNLIEGLKKNQNSRRHILNAWNPAELHVMSLPPCHAFSQFYVSNNKLSCQLYQRSCDMFLGVPFNIASYSILIHIIAKECGYEVGEFVHSLGDFHIYEEQFEQVKIQ